MPSLENELYLAALLGDEDEAVRLLAQGADPNAANAQGNTPLHAAVTELPWALRKAGKEKPDLTGLLLDAGAQPNVRNRAGITPLMRALAMQRSYQFLDVDKDDNAIGALLRHGADPSLGLFLPRLINVPMQQAGRTAFNNFTRMLERLFEAGLDPDRRDPAGMSLMHHVCAGRLDAHDRDLLRFLAGKGADIRAITAMGRQPVHVHAASSEATADSIRLLRELGADLRAMDQTGRTPLHHVCANRHRGSFYKDHVSLIGALMDVGQDVDARDNNGNTPFDLLAQVILRAEHEARFRAAASP